MKETIKCYNFNKLNLKVENLLIEKNIKIKFEKKIFNN